VLLVGQGLCSAAERFVATTGSDAADGSQQHPWRTISWAVQTVTPGTRINVAAGRYAEAVRITKSLTLVGAGRDLTFITKALPPGGIVDITTSGVVTVQDLAVSGWEQPGDGARGGLQSFGAELTVRRVDFYSIYNVNLAIIGGTFLIDDVRLFASELPGYMISCDLGIMISDAAGEIRRLFNEDHVDHVVDHSGRFYVRPDGDTIWEDTTDGKDLVLRDSVITGRNFAWGDGVRFYGDGSNRVRIENCLFSGSPSTPVPGPGTENPLPNAVSVYGVHLTLQDNRIVSFPTGLLLQDRIQAFAQGNAFADNGMAVRTLPSGSSLGVIDLGGGPLASLGRNSFGGSTIWDVANESATVIWARGNSWQAPVKIRDQRVDPSLGPVLEGSLRPARRRTAGGR